MRIGIFGGSFDPIHIGHLIVAQEALHRAALERVLVLPTARAPHKPSGARVSIEDRLAMVRLAIAGVPGLEAAEVEARDETSYTVDTLRWARDAFGPDAELYLIIGADSLADLRSWREPDRITDLATLLVYPRRGADPQEVPYPYRMLEGETIEVSSSALRHRLREGAPVRFWIPEPVRAYIEREGLYRGADAC